MAQASRLILTVAIPGDVAKAAFGSQEPEPSYNAVANLNADFFGDPEGAPTFLNKADEGEPDGTGSDTERTLANAVAVAGEGEVTLTVPLDRGFADMGIKVASLGEAENATAELDGEGYTCTFHLRDASGTYEFAGASADYAGMAQASRLILTVDLSKSGIDLDSVFPQEPEPDFTPGVYAVTANLYVLDGDTPVYLTALAPSGIAQEIKGSLNADGSIVNGARIMSRSDGTTFLDIWLTDDAQIDSLGASSDGAIATISDSETDKSGYYARFQLIDLKGTYTFANASVIKNGKTYNTVYVSAELSDASSYYPSNTAPFSGNTELEDGTYTVTANLYVPGDYNPILVGFNAYMGSSDFPPTSPMVNTGTLTIEGGHTYLDLPLLCTAFTLQKVSGGVGATVVETEYGSDGTVLDTLPGLNYITHLRFELTDLSTGYYSFEDCDEYPVPVGETWHFPMYLKVDLANAHDPADDLPKNHDVTLVDSTGSMSLHLVTESDEAAKSLEGATFTAARISDGDEYEAITKQVKSLLVNAGGETAVVYTTTLTDVRGNTIDLSSFTTVELNILKVRNDFSVPQNSSMTDSLLYFTYDGTELHRFKGIGYTADAERDTLEMVSWNADQMGTFVLVHLANYPDENGKYNGAAKLPVTLELSATGSEASLTGHFFDLTSAIPSEKFDLLELVSTKDSAGNLSARAREAIEQTGMLLFANNAVAAYTAGVVYSADQSMARYWNFYEKDDRISFSFPTLTTGDAQVYLVQVSSDGNVSASLLTNQSLGIESVQIANGIATVTWSYPKMWLDYSNAVDKVFQALYRGAVGDPNGEGYAYYAVVSNTESDNIVPAEPVAASSLIYTGKPQAGVASGEGYTLSGDFQATDAGTYTATATLDAGYVWKDGSKDAKTIEWSIDKATLTVTYAGEQVMRGVEPGYAVSVEGFVDGENVANAVDFTMPAIADEDKPAASELVTGFSKELAPSGGSARNYQFKYVGGTLKVVAAAGDLKPGTYTVTANLFVPGELNTVLVGVNAYLTNPSTPLTDGSAPTKPVSDNATLTVAEDGAITLDLDVVNPVFTLQKIDGSTNAQATVTGKGDSVGTTDAQYKTRISKLSIKLSDTSGTYVFSDCLEYPTLLSQVWTVPLTLNVDFSNVDTVEPTPDPTPDPEPGQVTKVDAPRASGDLTYNGKTQTGVAASKAYTLTGATAKDAGTYTATATLNEGYEWADGTTAPKTITYTIAKAKLTATYAGETVVEGATPAYAVNVTGFVNGETVLTAEGFKAPSVSAVASGKLVAGESFELTPAGGAAKNYSYIYVAGTLKVVEPADTDAIAPGTYQITANLYVPGELNTVLGKNAYLTNASTPLTDGNAPLTPVSDNAKLVVRADGSRVLVIPVVNPVFTLQSASDGANVKVLGSVRGNDVAGSTQVKGRITELYVELGDDSGSYQLGACTEYPTLLEQQWNVPLRISADFSSLKKLSSTATITIPGQNEGDNGSNSGDNNQGGDNNGNQGNNGSADNNGTNGDQDNNGTNSDNSDGSYRLSAGTYTVTANIWLSDRSTTGLPLMPYLTSGEFPPMNPVTGNATLTVDETGHATLYVPIVIQSKVMTVSGISGLDIIGVDYAGGYVSGVTVDLGTITDMSGVITRSCSATIVMGSLASTISGITGSHTWPATFQVVFTGVPVSGNAGSSYDWNKAATAAAGVGALAAEGTGASADMGFLAVATKAATQLAAHGAHGQAETSVAGNTAADFAAAGVSSSLSTLDPDEASGTDATAALALAASLSGGELSLSHTADAFDAKFLAA